MGLLGLVPKQPSLSPTVPFNLLRRGVLSLLLDKNVQAPGLQVTGNTKSSSCFKEQSTDLTGISECLFPYGDPSRKGYEDGMVFFHSFPSHAG